MKLAMIVIGAIQFTFGIFSLWMYWPMLAIGPCVRFGWWCSSAYRP
jgi:hypothetical protein